MDVMIVGANLGSASGWDQVADNIYHFYDFVPLYTKLETEIPCDISIDMESGIWELYDSATGTQVIRSGKFLDLFLPTAGG